MFSNSKKIFIALTTIVLIIVLFFILNKKGKSQSEWRDLADIKKSGRLYVVTDNSALGFKINNINIVGFNYEIVKAFADTMGLELEINTLNNLDSCIEGINNGTYDIIAINIPTTTPLKSELAFTSPMYSSRQVLIQKKDAEINHKPLSYNFLSTDSICIPSFSPYKFRLNNLSNEIAKEIKVVEMREKNTEDLVKMVVDGKIKYTVCDELYARKLKIIYPEISIETAIGFTQPMAWSVNMKSTKLLNALNVFLNDFTSTSDYWKIYRKYF